MNSKAHANLGYEGFHGKSIDEAWYLLEWIARGSFELKRQVVSVDIRSWILVHSMLDLIMPLFSVTCVILLTMILIHAIILCMLYST